MVQTSLPHEGSWLMAQSRYSNFFATSPLSVNPVCIEGMFAKAILPLNSFLIPAVFEF